MSTKRHGEKLLSDLSKAVLFLLGKSVHTTVDTVIKVLGKTYEEDDVRKRIYNLKYGGFIAENSAQNLHLTSKGKTSLYNLKLHELPTPKFWDKKWRIVIYDIPENKRPARDKIRFLLKDLGFQNLQISAWVHPLPCLDQFENIRKAYGVKKHLLLLEVDDSEEFNSIKNYFSKRYPFVK